MIFVVMFALRRELHAFASRFRIIGQQFRAAFDPVSNRRHMPEQAAEREGFVAE
jgi:hypothetical protein